MFTLQRHEYELFGVFATEVAAASALESILDANRASDEYPEEEYEDAWAIVRIQDMEAV